MLLKQNDISYRIIIFLIYIFLMIAVCSSSPIHQRLRRDATKSNCNGDVDQYQSFCYGLRTDNVGQEDDVQRCFDKLHNSYRWKRNVGRLSENKGRCRCTVKSSSKRKREEIFKKARTSLYQQCCGFTYYVMGYYEDDMRLIVICN